mgnify:CR=1 FL=1
MESGLEGRNNADHEGSRFEALLVSMKSGLEGRNNYTDIYTGDPITIGSQ